MTASQALRQFTFEGAHAFAYPHGVPPQVQAQLLARNWR